MLGGNGRQADGDGSGVSKEDCPVQYMQMTDAGVARCLHCWGGELTFWRFEIFSGGEGQGDAFDGIATVAVRLRGDSGTRDGATTWGRWLRRW